MEGSPQRLDQCLAASLFPPPVLPCCYPPLSPPPSRPLLQKCLQNSASHLVQPQSSPLLPYMVRIALYSAARLPACAALPARLGLAAQPAAAASKTWTPPPPSSCTPRITLALSRPWTGGARWPPGQGWLVWAAATMAAGGSFVLRTERARGR